MQGIEIFGQAIVIEFGGFAMRTAPQSGELWGTAIAFGSGSLIWNVVLHYFVKDEWVPQWFINIFKVTLKNSTEEEEEETAAPPPAATVNETKLVVDADGNVSPQPQTTDPLMADKRPRSESVNSRKHLSPEGRPRSDSTGSHGSGSDTTLERVSKFLVGSKRVQSGLRVVQAFQHGPDVRALNMSMVEKARRLRERSGVRDDSEHHDLADKSIDELSGVGAQALWSATLDTIRKQVMPVAAFRDALKGGEGAPGPDADDGDLELGHRTKSYTQALSSASPAASPDVPPTVEE